MDDSLPAASVLWKVGSMVNNGTANYLGLEDIYTQLV